MVGSVLITGANRGLGLGFARALAQKSPIVNANKVIAACRNPDQSKELHELCQMHSNFHIIKLDVSDLGSFDKVAKEVSDINQGLGLNLLINNAGVSTKFSTLAYVKSQQLLDNFMINTVGPIMLTKSCLPLLKTASDRNKDLKMGIERAAVINMSSYLGSMDMNDKGGFYPYRCSKAALNAATKSMSIDFKRDHILAISIHPGWVKTDMGGNNAPLDIESSINGILNILKNLNENDSGKFYQYDGKELPW